MRQSPPYSLLSIQAQEAALGFGLIIVSLELNNFSSTEKTSESTSQIVVCVVKSY